MTPLWATIRIPRGPNAPAALVTVDLLGPAPVEEINRCMDRCEGAALVQNPPFGEKSTGAPMQTRPGRPGEPGLDPCAAVSHGAAGPAAAVPPDAVDFPRSGGGDAAHRGRETLDGVRAEIEAARRALAERSAEVAELDARLCPGNAELRRLHDEVRSTHGRRGDAQGRILVALDTGRRGDRAPLFRALDANAAAWGPTRAARADAGRQVRELERDVARLERDAGRLAKRRRKG